MKYIGMPMGMRVLFSNSFRELFGSTHWSPAARTVTADIKRKEDTAKSYMRGYRDIYKNVGLFHRLMIRFCDSLVRMKIVKISFGG